MNIRSIITIISFLFVSGITTAGANAEKLNDAQIAHVAYTAGVIDSSAAKLALTKSKNKMIREFANSMYRDHEAVNMQALDLVRKLNVTPQDNDVSKSLNAAAKKNERKLKKLSGRAFDKAYIDNEVAYHKLVNNALETTLIPSSSNSELKSLLQTGLKLFQGHQMHAEHVSASFR